MPSRVLICNLTRFGDLLQTQPLIDDLKKAGHAVALICLENFADATCLMRHLEQVFPFPGAAVSNAIDTDWSKALRICLDFGQNATKLFNPDFIINLTPTLPSRLLSGLLTQKGAKLLGFGLDEQGFGQNNGLWASFISMAAHARRFASFNLADMQRRMAWPLARDFSGPFELAKPDNAGIRWAQGFIRENLADNCKPSAFVCFQLGASEERRRWPVDNFLRLGSTLWAKAKICPILTGSSQENELAAEYLRKAKHPCVNATGKTSLEQLAALLSQCRLLVTNDTGTMHVAAGLGIPSLAFFLATAQPWDTGPLLPGCCCLEPNLHCHPCGFSSPCEADYACKTAISPAAAAQLALLWLKTGDWRKGVDDKVKKECRVWITGKNADGMSRLLPISGQERAQDVQWMYLMRCFWSQLLDDLDGIQRKNDDPQESLPPHDPKAAEVLAQAQDLLRLLMQNGTMLGITRKSAQTFLKNCRRLQSILDVCPGLESIGAFWRDFQQNQGTDLKKFLPSLKILAKNFQWLEERLSVPAARP